MPIGSYSGLSRAPVKWAGSVLAVQLSARPLSRVALLAVRILLTERRAGMPMSSPERSNGAGGRPLDPATRRSARIAGVWWVITFVTSIPAGALRPAAQGLQVHPHQQRRDAHPGRGVPGGRSRHLGHRDLGRDV